MPKPKKPTTEESLIESLSDLNTVLQRGENLGAHFKITYRRCHMLKPKKPTTGERIVAKHIRFGSQLLDPPGNKPTSKREWLARSIDTAIRKAVKEAWNAAVEFERFEHAIDRRKLEAKYGVRI